MARSARARSRAAAIDGLEVTKQRGLYSLEANAKLDATPESIYAVLTDFDDNAYSRISRAYKESRYLDPAADGTPLVYTRMEGCMLWHCMTLERERLETQAPRWIKSTAARGQQLQARHVGVDARARWGRHENDLQARRSPTIFVPPVIGPWYLKRTLSQGGQRAVTRIERLARELDGRPVEPLPPAPSSARTRSK